MLFALSPKLGGAFDDLGSVGVSRGAVVALFGAIVSPAIIVRSDRF